MIRQLAYLTKDLTFRVRTSGKRDPKDKTPIVLQLRGFRCYEEVEKRNEFERIGINVNVKQIALATWKDTSLPDLAVTFYPGKWKLPKPPKELEKLLQKFAKKK